MSQIIEYVVYQGKDRGVVLVSHQLMEVMNKMMFLLFRDREQVSIVANLIDAQTYVNQNQDNLTNDEIGNLCERYSLDRPPGR